MKDKEFYKWYKRMIENNPEHPPASVWEEIERGLDRDLFNWYKGSIEDNSEEPPQQVWENIEDRLDENLYQWYGQGITQNAEEPPEEVWNNIQDDLDIEDSWEHISEKLDQNTGKRRKLIFYAAAAALLAFLVLQVFSPFEKNLPFSDTQQEYVSGQDNGGRVGPEEGGIPAADSAAGPQEQMAGDIEPTTGQAEEAQAEKIVAEEEPSAEKPEKERELLARSEQPTMNKKSPETIRFQVASDADIRTMSQTRMDFSTAAKEEKPQTDQKARYYVGITGETGQSWLLSQKTLYSIRKSPYSTASPNRGRSFGIVGGVKFNDRLSVQLEGMIQNESGQNYREYLDGQVINNQIYLDYSSLDIMGRYQILQHNFPFPLSHHAVLGLYGSYLKNARQKLNGNIENLRSAYKNYDLGVILGYEFDTRLSPDFIITTGFRVDPGFINIYEGVPNLPADLNRTYSSSIKLNISLKYNL